jgi:hypothetical protein
MRLPMLQPQPSRHQPRRQPYRLHRVRALRQLRQRQQQRHRPQTAA